MTKPDYCTQNNGNCETCSLSNYGKDCMNNPIKNPDLSVESMADMRSDAFRFKTVKVDRETWRKLKIFSAETEKSINQIVKDLVNKGYF